MKSVALWAAIGPGLSILVFSFIVTCVLMNISPLSGDPGLLNIIFSSNIPSEEPNSPIWTPFSSVPVTITITPSNTLVAPVPNLLSPSLVAIGCTSIIVSL